MIAAYMHSSTIKMPTRRKRKCDTPREPVDLKRSPLLSEYPYRYLVHNLSFDPVVPMVRTGFAWIAAAYATFE